MSDAWTKCSRRGCRAFGLKQLGASCEVCTKPLRGHVSDEEFAIDMRLLERALERAKGEVARIETRIAELTKIGGG